MHAAALNLDDILKREVGAILSWKHRLNTARTALVALMCMFIKVIGYQSSVLPITSVSNFSVYFSLVFMEYFLGIILQLGRTILC